MTRVDIQIYIDGVSVSDVVSVDQKIQTFLVAEPNAICKRFIFNKEGLNSKLNVTLSVPNVTIPEIGAIKTKIQNYLDSQPNSHQTLFSWVED